MRKFLLFALFISYTAFGQVYIDEGFEALSGTETPPTGWEGTMTGGYHTGSCSGSYTAHGTMSGATTTKYLQSVAQISNGTAMDVSFSYAARVPGIFSETAAGIDFGSLTVSYSTDGGTTFTSAYVVDNNNHVVTTDCATVSFTIADTDLPSSASIVLKFDVLRTSTSALSFYLDDIKASQTITDPPNCDAVLTETTNIHPNIGISWSPASGATAGYKVSLSSDGGVTYGAAVDVGNVTSYLPELESGTTYYVKITSYNSVGDATGCNGQSFTTAVAPDNDKCENAEELIVNSGSDCYYSTSGTVYYATDSGVDNYSGTEDDDVWYKFKAFETSHVVTLFNEAGDSTNLRWAVYDGGSTGACPVTGAEELVGAGSSSANPDVRQLNGLTVGNWYIIQVYSNASDNENTTFDICITGAPTPPDNDDCDGAYEITPSADLTCTAESSFAGTFYGATDSGVDSSCTSTNNDDDVWFKFTATAETHLITISNIVGNSSSAYYVLYDANPCSGTATELACVYYNYSTYTLSEGLTIGQTYYIQVYTATTLLPQETTFDICITTPPAPANDLCSGAVSLSAGTQFSDHPVDGTVAWATVGDETTPSSSCDNGNYPGVWYTLTVPKLIAGGNLNIETGVDAATGDTGFDSVIEVYKGSCETMTFVKCDDHGAATNNFSLVTLTEGTDVVEGDVLYIRVTEDGGNDNEPFSISAWGDLDTLGLVDLNPSNGKGIKYYPNPVSDQLTISADENIKSVQIYNVAGQLVQELKVKSVQSNVNFHKFAKGAYVVKVVTEDGKTDSFKVIKK